MCACGLCPVQTAGGRERQWGRVVRRGARVVRVGVCVALLCAVGVVWRPVGEVAVGREVATLGPGRRGVGRESRDGRVGREAEGRKTFAVTTAARGRVGRHGGPTPQTQARASQRRGRGRAWEGVDERLRWGANSGDHDRLSQRPPVPRRTPIVCCLLFGSRFAHRRPQLRGASFLTIRASSSSRSHTRASEVHQHASDRTREWRLPKVQIFRLLQIQTHPAFNSSSAQDSQSDNDEVNPNPYPSTQTQVESLKSYLSHYECLKCLSCKKRERRKHGNRHPTLMQTPTRAGT